MPATNGPIHIRICFIKNGKEHSVCLSTDALGEFSWTPPKGVTEVYFRANDTTNDGSVILSGGESPVSLLPFHSHKADAMWTEIPAGGKVTGKVIHSETIHRLTSYKFEYLPPEVNTLQLIEEEEVELKISPKLRAILDQKPVEADTEPAEIGGDSQSSKKKRKRRNWWWRLTHKTPSF